MSSFQQASEKINVREAIDIIEAPDLHPAALQAIAKGVVAAFCRDKNIELDLLHWSYKRSESAKREEADQIESQPQEPERERLTVVPDSGSYDYIVRRAPEQD